MLFSRPAFLLFAVLALAVPCHARQDTTGEAIPDAPPVRKTPGGSAAEFRYDAGTQGVLFYIVLPRSREENGESAEAQSDSPPPVPEQKPDTDPARRTAAQFAASINHRLLREAHLSALVPQTMFVVAPVPKNGDPFIGMGASERFQLLLGTLGAAQWKLAGGDTGIGAGDLTDEQRPLFDGLFPATPFQLQTYRMSPERGEDDEAVWQPVGEEKTQPVRGARLRLRRQTTVSFTGADGDGYFSTVNRDDDDNFASGETKTDLVNGYSLSGDPPAERVEDEQTAFGARITYTEANRAKPSDLNMESPVFKTSVILDGSHKTVGDLIAVCAKKTRLNLIADKRMATLPITWRVGEGGHAVPSGEVLTLLSRALTGTFRKLTPATGAPVYLLTDDREGLGTRLNRLRLWQERMRFAKDALIGKATRAAARFDPLSHVRFAPDDPLALPPAVSDAADSAYRASENGATANLSELPPALRDNLSRTVKQRSEYDKDVSPSRIRVGSTLICEYVFPGGGAIITGFGRGISSDYLRNVATITPVRLEKPAKPEKAVPVKSMPTVAPRRVCAVPMPVTDDDIKAVLVLIRAKGFAEAWLTVPLRAADTPERMEKAVAVGKAIGIKIGAAAAWLKSGLKGGTDDTGSVADINIAGETGARATAAFTAMFREQIENGNMEQSLPPPDEIEYVFDFLTRYMSDWMVPDGKAGRTALAKLLYMPELSAVVLTDTVAPGWIDAGTNGGGMPPGFYLGATLPTRIACVRGVGVDPVDVVETGGMGEYVPIFGGSEYNAESELQKFRFAENRRELALLTAGIASAAPLYLEKPTAFFQPTKAGYTRFAPGETKPGKPTKPTPPAEALPAYVPTMEYETGKVIKGVLETARTGAKSGFVINFGQLRIADALRYLKSLPDAGGK